MNLGVDNDLMDCLCPFEGCGKMFNSKWSMTRHLRTHTGDKPFKCTIPGCGKEFVERCALKRHEQTHAKAKSWICDFPGCEKKFKLKEYLDVHKRTHFCEPIKPAVRNQQVPNEFIFPQQAQQRIENIEENEESKVVMEQLRNRLVRMSVRHHDELMGQMKEMEWLKQSLLECSNALHEAISLLRSLESNGRIIPIPQCETKAVVPSKLTEIAAKFNIENISAACKSSMVAPSNSEQMSFLSMCKNEPPPPNSMPINEISSALPTKGSTMSIIESLMTSALNADKVLSTLNRNKENAMKNGQIDGTSTPYLKNFQKETANLIDSTVEARDNDMDGDDELLKSLLSISTVPNAIPPAQPSPARYDPPPQQSNNALNILISMLPKPGDNGPPSKRKKNE